MRAVARALWQRYRPARRDETEHQWFARRYPRLVLMMPWTDGTD